MKKIKEQVQEILRRDFPISETLSAGYLEKGNCINMHLKWGKDNDEDTKFKFSYEIVCDDTPQWLIDIHELMINRANELVRENWVKFVAESDNIRYLSYELPDSDNMFEIVFFTMDELEQPLGRLDMIKVNMLRMSDKDNSGISNLDSY